MIPSPTTDRFSIHGAVHVGRVRERMMMALDLFMQTFPDDSLEARYDVCTCNQIVTIASRRFAWWWTFFGGRAGVVFKDGDGQVLG